MKRIGIIGSDNSHAMVFSKLFNLPEKDKAIAPADYRVTAIFGTDAARTREVAEVGAIETIVNKPEEMLGKVDAVMVVWRHGDLHAPYALPFIEAGIPTWVDKPFAIKVADAKAMIAAAEKKNTPLSGGSTLKQAHDVLAMRESIQGADGKGLEQVVAGYANYHAALENEYGGIYFYGAHLAELTLTLFGYNPKSVVAVECAGNVCATLKYDNYHVAMNFLDKTKSNCYVVAHKHDGAIMREMDLVTAYRGGMVNFLKMLADNKSPFPLEWLLTPVVLMQAIEKSRLEKREVTLSELL